MENLRDKVAKKVAANPAIKTGMLAETLRVPEADILRAMPEGYARELHITNMEAFVTKLEGLGLLYFVTRNDACVTEIKGRFGGFSKSGPFFNVIGEHLHLHLRLDRIESVFHVTPPSGDGRPAWPSLQFYQPSGHVAFKVFLIEAIQTEAGEDWEASLRFLRDLAGMIVAPGEDCPHRSPVDHLVDCLRDLVRGNTRDHAVERIPLPLNPKRHG